MKTNAKPEKYDLFLHAVKYHLNRRFEAFENAKKQFLERAQKFPTDAIAWWGETVSENEEAHRALAYAASCLDSFVPGVTYETRRELLAAIAEEFRKTIILDSTGGKSTCDFRNATERSSVRGRCQALRDIESLLNHEAI